MFKYTANTLKKIEDILKGSGYILRYEKGNFKSGYCILQEKKVVVINKYFSLEGKINCLLEILPTIEIDEQLLDELDKSFLEKLLQKS